MNRVAQVYNFDKEWNDNHIPTLQRLKKINEKYVIEECPHCIQFYEKLKMGKFAAIISE